MSDTVISSVFICPKCKYTNPSKSKFCMQCGAPLSVGTKESQTIKLVLIEKGKVKEEFPLSEKTTLGKGGTISVDGANFSKEICEFHVNREKISLKVLGDGVFIKLNPETSVDLEIGSEIKIGDKLFRVES